MQPQWERWRDWYGGVAESTQFLPPDGSAPPEPPSAHLARLLDRCRPHYEALHGQRLRPEGQSGAQRSVGPRDSTDQG